MENHPLYKKLRQAGLENNYTVDQIRNLSFNQATELLDTRSFSETFLNNMKRSVVVVLQSRDDESDFERLKQVAESWLITNFPEWEAECGRDGHKPYIKIWLRGKPA
jgi:hypothetical protein